MHTQWGHYSNQTALEVNYNLRFEISDPNYLLIHVHLAYMAWSLLAASEATTASKQPRRSKLSLQVKLVTPIYYMTKFQGIFISQNMTLLLRRRPNIICRLALHASKKVTIMAAHTCVLFNKVENPHKGRCCWAFSSPTRRRRRPVDDVCNVVCSLCDVVDAFWRL